MLSRTIRTVICILLIVITTSLLGCGSRQGKHTAQSLNNCRPAAATGQPDFSGNITDIRVTSVERPFVFYDNSGQMHPNFKDYTFLQVYYGYCSNGVWYDLPLENYPLKSPYDENAEGYDLAQETHLVKIGPYVLFCYTVVPGVDKNPQLSDTLGTQPQIMFREYDAPKYGFLKEKCTPSGKLVDYTVSTAFPVRHFMIVEYEAITEDYELAVQTSYTDDAGIETVTMETISAQAIWNALEP